MTYEESPRIRNEAAMILRGYTFGKTIGKGTYGKVILSNYMNSKGEITTLACKYLDKTKMPSQFLDTFLDREIQIVMNLNHPHIIRMHAIYQSNSAVYIFMRYAEKGDLLDYIKDNGYLEEVTATSFFVQMTSAVKYLHDRNIAHRDLKCENILISKNMNCKLGDFGFARYVVDMEDKKTKILSNTHCGSPLYAAPEVNTNDLYDPLLADVWSLGVILSIMLNGIMPFTESKVRKLVQDQINRGYNFDEEIMSKVSTNCKKVLYFCLEPNPKKRYTINDVFNSKWIQEFIKTYNLNIHV